ncbi:MAG: hypothetical protein V4480_04920 [Patescibacteria group bacterium]
MTPRYVVLEKPRGQTPLETLVAWQALHPQFSTLPASYAGRLDPMASGKLLVLLGEECKKQGEYRKLDKEYEIEVVLDLSTDTGDALGLPAYAEVDTNPDRKLREVLKHLEGAHMVPYPAFSSKTVSGKPLFQYALEGTLDTITIPDHEETIYQIRLRSLERLTRAGLQERIDTALVSVPRSDEPSKELGADFRQDVIRAGWRVLFAAMPERSFVVLRLRVSCASGAYMRTLASRIGESLETRGFALSIRRSRIGVHNRFGPFRIWAKKF